LLGFGTTTGGIGSLPLKRNAPNNFFGAAPSLPLNFGSAKSLFRLGASSNLLPVTALLRNLPTACTSLLLLNKKRLPYPDLLLSVI
jgi:hypothetical protein